MEAMNRLLAAAALGAFFVAIAVIAFESTTSGGGPSTKPTTTAARTVTQATEPTTTRPAPSKAVAVKLIGAGAYDPEGDKHENDDLAPLAVDGDPSTFWKTEHYTHGFFKTGVGLLLDAGRTVRLSRVAVGTDGAGSSARIELGDSPTGPFRVVSVVRPLTGTTSFALRKGATGRYLVIWITAVPPSGEAHVTEVRATAAARAG
jgi:hypothetical protein